MPDLTIKDFRGGLDARKFLLSLPAGTLMAANNVHINQGAEAEKRKAFMRLINSSNAVLTSLPAGTFGWQALATGHVVFGSNDGAALTFPPAVTYQRLQHPAVLNGTAYSAGSHAMTAIITSETMAGKAFAVAQFADGNSFAYYDGALVNDFTSGLILAYLSGSDSKIAAAIVALVNQTTAYTATQQGSTGKLDVLGIPGNAYSTDITKTSTNGTLAAQLVNNGLATVAGQQPVGQFQIVSGSAGVANFISSVKVNNVETLKNAAAILFTTDEATTASLVANSISSNAATSGYYAVAAGTIVSIIALVSGTSANGYEVKTAAAGNVCIGSTAFTLGGDSTVGMTSILSSAILGRTTQRAHALFVATLTIGAHNFLSTEIVTVSGMGDTRYNGTQTLTAVTATTISFNTSTSFTEAAIADTGGTVVYTAGSNIMGGAVAGTTSGLNALATAIATAIRTNSGSTGYLANSVGATVYVSKVTTSSSDAPVSLVATTAGSTLTLSTLAGSTQIGLTAYTVNMNASPSFLSTTTKSATSGTVSVVLGGVTNPPFTYKWEKVSESFTTTLTNFGTSVTLGKITVSSDSVPAVTFTYAGGDHIQENGGNKNTMIIKSTWKCTIKDNIGNTYVTNPIDIIVTATV